MWMWCELFGKGRGVGDYMTMDRCSWKTTTQYIRNPNDITVFNDVVVRFCSREDRVKDISIKDTHCKKFLAWYKFHTFSINLNLLQHFLPGPKITLHFPCLFVCQCIHTYE